MDDMPAGLSLSPAMPQAFMSAQYGPSSQMATCSACNARMMTKIKHKSNSKTHMVALCLCLFLCWPCVCLPYCCNSCRNVNHYCSCCKQFLGTYQQ